MEQFPEEDGVTFYRPIGGTVEYGEDSKSAVIREVKEEINEDIIEAKLLGVIENIFRYGDEVGHEFDFIYSAQFLNPEPYEKAVVHGVEQDMPFIAVWKPVSDFRNDPKIKLVPDGLFELLTNEGKSDSIHHIKHISTKEA